VTFPYEETRSGDAAGRFASEFDALMERLNHRVSARVEEERDIRRRTRLFAFPQQMAALRDPLAAFVSDVFSTTQFDQQVLLRGVYMTSGTQEGTPIDRLLGAIVGRYGLSADAVAPPGGRGKAYFVERLLKEVLIGESGLAGADLRGEMAKAALHLSAYAAAVLIAVLGVIALTVSYRRNDTYLARVTADLETFNKVPPVREGAAPDRVLTRLNAVRALNESANVHTGNVPWAMRWGLYQGSGIGSEAADAYKRELDNLLLPQVKKRFEERVVQHRADPDRQLDALKAYLMLDDPQHLDREFLRERADAEWGPSGPSADPNAATFATHLTMRLNMDAELPRAQLDQKLIAQVRTSLQQASIAVIIYKEIQRQYAEDPASAARAVSLDRAGTSAGLIRRKSGISLAQSLPSLYSKAVFHEVTDAGSSFDLVKRYAADDWVLGKSVSWLGDPTRLRNEVFQRYEYDYIAAWNRVLDDLELALPTGAAEYTSALGTLSGPESPLRNLIATVVDNTKLEQAVPAAAPGLIASAKRSVETATKSLQRTAGMTPTGRLVTAHFQPYHRLIEGEPGKTPIDRVIAAMARLRSEWDAIVAAGAVARADESPTYRQSIQNLEQESQLLPPGLRVLPQQISGGIGHSIRVAKGLDDEKNVTALRDAEQHRMNAEQQRMTDIVTMYRQRVLPECNRIVVGRYPFTQGSDNNLPLFDFTTLFGPDGIFDNFFKTHLTGEADATSQPWRWKTESARKYLPVEILRVFENAAEVREAFFQGGSKSPMMQYTARLLDFDESAATRFRLDIEGQPLDSQQRKQDYGIQWPGPKPAHVEVLFDGRWSTPYRETYNGQWAWFRLLERNKLIRESDTRNILTVSVGGVQARLAIEALTVKNPFANADWQRFKCGS
jgi:type VI secretion system protein ImpL